MADVHIVLEGQPQGKGRPRFSARGGFARAYTPAKTRSYEDRLRMAAEVEMDCARLLEGPLFVWIEAVFVIPKSWSKKKQALAMSNDLLPTGKPDVDNILKIVDALNGVVWKDDSQIVSAQIAKFYGTDPGLTIDVTRIGGRL